MLPFYIREGDPPAKRQILRAAMKLFSERGLDATSIRDIARESGYTNPALYKHFAGKEELALHLFETCHRRLWSKCNAAVDAAKSFDDKLEAYIGQVLALVDERMPTRLAAGAPANLLDDHRISPADRLERVHDQNARDERRRPASPDTKDQRRERPLAHRAIDVGGELDCVARGDV